MRVRRTAAPRAFATRSAVAWPVLAALLVACGAPAGTVDSDPSPAPGVEATVDVARFEPRPGEELFLRHCALCHGERGAGNGPAAGFLFPPARDFTRARFRLISTANGAPTGDDLVATLRRGVPGSAMPSWDWLPEDDLRDLAVYVRELAIDGVARRLLATDPGRLAVEEAVTTARARLTPGSSLEAFVPRARTPERLDRGGELYAASCAPCHGPDGRGPREGPLWNEDGSLNWARDFTAGVMKGGASDRALAHRILLGLPGTAMPPTELGADDLSALVSYVQHLLPPQSADQLVQRRQQVVVERVEGPVPWTPDDSRWDALPEREIVLAPLFWSTDAVFVVHLRAAHDGATIAVRLRWRDPTADGLELGGTPFADAAALLFSKDDEPPLYGMGSSDHPAVLWHWRSAGPERLAELALPPHAFASDATRYEPSIGHPSDDARAFDSSGFEALDEIPTRVRTRARRTAVGWDVVFVRSLAGAGLGDVALEPGRSAWFGCALWNGSAGDHRGRKSVTLWHSLELER